MASVSERDNEQNQVRAFGIGPEQTWEMFWYNTGEEAKPPTHPEEKAKSQNEKALQSQNEAGEKESWNETVRRSSFLKCQWRRSRTSN